MAYFYLDKNISPTFHQLSKWLITLGNVPTRFKWLAKLSMDNFAFDHDASIQLEYKHLLADLLQQHECMPLTYCIDDSNWANILALIVEQTSTDNVWILKPSLLNNGQHIKIFSDIYQLEKHYLSANRLGGPHVLQQYIASPHLLKGHKYTIRMFVVLTNYKGAFLYPEGYLNVALNPYEAHTFADLSGHLTNEHLNPTASNVIQIPTNRLNNFNALYVQIKSIVNTTIDALKQKHKGAFICKKKPLLAIYGFDFIVDSMQKVWLLEANHGPCFPIDSDHILQAHLYDKFWRAFVEEFI